MYRLLGALALATSVACQSHHSTCKPIFGTRDWPSTTAWSRLNETVLGRLIAPTPPGAVCHTEQPQFNNASCALLAGQWTNTSFHAMNPVSADYNDLTCLPDDGPECSPAGYPRYVVQAREAQDVQQAVLFAAETGVRLIVKGTGHDFLGRSSGAEALSIHTYYLKGLELNTSDPRATARGGSASLKIYAGERMRDLYAFAAKNNITAVGGADLNVGIGGWLSHGGHSPVSAHYGMGADQVLEMEVVTADGVLRTVDENNDPDLFWALRGGGGSNFAVMISVTMKVYPALPYTRINYAISTAPDSNAFWSLTAYWASQLPQLSEAGLMGYHYPLPLDPTENNASIAGKLQGSWIGPELSKPDIEALLEPMHQHIRTADWGSPILITNSSVSGDHFSQELISKFSADTAGKPARLGSRLLDGKALSKPLHELKHAFKTAHGLSTGLQIFNVAGKGAREPVGGVLGGSNALLPAWRSAYAHVVIPYTWATPSNETFVRHMQTGVRENATPALVSLAPDMGAYASESDPTEENWQETFYGDLYPRLLEIKKRWDPKGVFWYKNGVGSEIWTPVGPWGIENGVGQNPVQLCRVGGSE
ncbi:hypothetical protein Q7P37_002315 [Cladosporium fusiforme]